MDSRTGLRFAVTGMVTVGILVATLPFISSLSVTPKQDNDAWGTCDVSGLAEGATLDCGWATV